MIDRRSAATGLLLAALAAGCGAQDAGPEPSAAVEGAPAEHTGAHADHGSHTAHVDAASLITGEFALVDAKTGAAVTTRSYDGQWRLVFFGFTHCAAICPIGLGLMGETLEALGDRASEIRPLFITVDPARDDAARVATYLERYDPRIEGLVGSKAEVAAAMAAFRMEAHRIPTAGDSYQLDHPALFFLMDREGGYVRSLPSSGDGEDLAREIRDSLAARANPRNR